MVDFSQPLLGAGAQAGNDWTRANASSSVNFTGQAQFRRGFEAEIGIDALATADAELSKFINATVRGNAFAEARAGLRCQLPLNLFSDFGLAVSAQAVAQAAAGLQVGLGLSIGDFVALIQRNPDSTGLPLELVLLLLDESSLGGGFEVLVSASAMAYASVLITGEIVKEPGFRVLVDAGAGLGAGMGFGGSLDIGIRDFRRFYGRAVDRTVDSVIEGMTPFLREDAGPLLSVLRDLAPTAKMSLRVAYEIGDYVARQNPGTSDQDAANLANHCAGIILEEAQRFLFGKFLETGLRQMEQMLVREASGLGDGQWESLRPQREALANLLYQMPAEPFQPTPQNLTYWTNLVTEAASLLSLLPAQPETETMRGPALLFAATSLTIKAVESRVNQAHAYAFAIGAGRVSTPPPSFRGALTAQPGPAILSHINGVLGRGASQPLDYADLISYLVNDAIIKTLRDTLPEIDSYLQIFQDPTVTAGLNDVVRALLRNGGAFVQNSSGQLDPQQTLRFLLGSLDAFIEDRVNRELVPALNRRVADDNLNNYFNEVLVGSLLFVKNVAFQTVLDWDRRPVDKEAFKEALAGVITMLLGRSLVLVGDGFMAALQADMARACTHAAGRISGPNDPFRAMEISASPELKALVSDTLRVGGVVFGPLPEASRRRLRFILYDVMETLPPEAAEQSDFLTSLGDQFFIPNLEALQELADELLGISRDRFQRLVELLLTSGVEFILDAIEEFVQEMVEAVRQWLAGLERGIQDLQEAIARLEEMLRDLIEQAQQSFDEATRRLERLLEALASSQLRSRLRQELADAIYDDARAVLLDNLLYSSLPSPIRKRVREALKNAIGDIIEGPLLDPIFHSIGAIAGDLDSVLDDIQGLNPNEPLTSQLLDLLVDRMEDNIRDVFGGTQPAIQVGVTVEVLGEAVRFGLGRIELRFSRLFRVLRDAIEDVGLYEAELQSAAAALANAFRLQADIHARETERETKQKDNARLDRIRGEFSSHPKSIAILNPVQSLVYSDGLEVHIHLGGVPASYLGLQRNEQQRVSIFLNGSLIPSQAIARGDPFTHLKTPSLGTPMNLQDVITSLASGLRVTGRPTALQLTAAEADNGLSPAERTAPAGLRVRSSVGGRRSLPSGPLVVQRFQPAKTGGVVVRSSLTNVLPGRLMPGSKREELVDGLPPGISLRFRVEPGQLALGTNTLAVVVIDPGGRRYQQAVSFGVASPAKGAESAPRLPGVTGRPTPGVPGIPAGRIAEHYQRDLLRERLEKGRSFAAQVTSSRIRILEAADHMEGPS